MEIKDLRQKAMSLKIEAATMAHFHSTEVTNYKSALGKEALIQHHVDLEQLATKIEDAAGAYYDEVCKLEKLLETTES